MTNKGGAPPGNQNASKGRRWREALDKALKQYSNASSEQRPEYVVQAGQALDRIAMNVVHRAVYGDAECIDEIANRLDGKPAQAIIGGGEDDPAVKLVHRVERVLIGATKNPADPLAK